MYKKYETTYSLSHNPPGHLRAHAYVYSIPVLIGIDDLCKIKSSVIHEHIIELNTLFLHCLNIKF